MVTSLLAYSGFSLSQARRRILGEGAWVAGGQLATALGMLIGIRLLTEFVAPAIYGTVSLLLGVGILGFNIFCSPLLLASTRFYSIAAQHGELIPLRRTLYQLLWAAALALGLIGMAGAAAYTYLTGQSAWAFAAVGGVIVVDLMRGLELSFLRAARRQRPAALWSAAEAWGRPLAALLAITVLQASPVIVLLGYIAASLACWLIFVGITKREGLADSSGARTASPSLRRDILHYALPLAPMAIVAWASAWSDRYIVGSAIGLGQVGLYAAAIGLVSRPFLMATEVVGQTLRPIYFNLIAEGNHRAATRLFHTWLRGAAAICGSGVFLFAVAGQWVGGLLLAEQYHSILTLLPWMAIGFALFALSNTLGERFLAHQRTRALSVIKSIMATFYVVLALVLIPRFGLPGAVATHMTYSLLSVVLLGWLGRKCPPSEVAREGQS